MFFSRKTINAIVLIKAHDIVLFRKGRPESVLTVPLDVIQYLEIRDATKLSALLADFFRNQPLNGQHVLILLDKTVVFQKMVVLDEKISSQDAQADFAAKLPFNPENGQTLTIQQNDKVFLFGINRALHLAVKQALELQGAHVDAVTPASVYGIAGNIDSSKFNEIRDAEKTTRGTDFLTHQSVATK